MKSCVGKFEELKTDPLKFSQIVPDPYSDLVDAYILLVQFIKQNFCRNCESKACMKNKKNAKSDIKVGTRVRLDLTLPYLGVRKDKGRVSKVELVKIAKTSNTKTAGRYQHKSVDCSSSCNGRDCSCCHLCKLQNYEDAVDCDGIHSTSEVESVFSSTSLCKVQLEGGQEVVTVKVTDVVFDC